MQKSQSHNYISRTFFSTVGVVLAMLVTASCQKPTASGNSPTPAKKMTPSKAVTSSSPKQDNIRPSLALSLTVLQEEVVKQRHPLSDELAHLGGMNRIQGIVIEDGEIVLLGARDPDPSSPPLELEALVIALRNAFQVSPAYGGVLGCTIDPWVGSKDPWRIQEVKVFGMPTTVTMAARHVAIDYELKKVSAGLLSFAGVPSQWEMTRLASPLCEGPADKEMEAAHRFWFYPLYPPAPRFMEEAGTVLILKPVEVQLMTEQEFLDRTGKRTGAAPPSPLADRFAHAITELLASNQLRHYAQFRNDFRVIEVSQLFRFKHIPAQSLRYFLQDYPLTEVKTPAFVGGIRREERGEVVCDSEITERRAAQGAFVGSTERVYRYHHMSRGGVEAKIQLAPEHFVEERSGVLADLRHRVWASRPSAHALLWPNEL